MTAVAKAAAATAAAARQSSALTGIVREASIGIALGIVGGYVWHHTVTAPADAAYQKFNKTLKESESSK
jgi:hypothetical protein